MNFGRISLKKNIAITGASGCLGRSLLRVIDPLQYRVSLLFRNETYFIDKHKEIENQIFTGNLSNKEILDNFLKNTEILFHFAADMSKNQTNKVMNTNYHGTKNLLESSLKNKIKLFIYVSSISVYRATPSHNQIYTENQIPILSKKLNDYSYSKLKGEELVKNFCIENEINYLIIRPTNVFGPYSKPWHSNIVNFLNKVPICFGNVKIDMIYVDDLTKSLIDALNTPTSWNNDYNLGHEMISLEEVIFQVAHSEKIKTIKISNFTNKIISFSIDYLYPLFRKSLPSVSFTKEAYYPHQKAYTNFKFKPTTHLIDGLQKTQFILNKENRNGNKN